MNAETREMRAGHFTSSNIHKLVKNGRGEFKFGAPALTYIEEKQIERRMGSCLDLGGYSRAMAWGSFMETVVLDYLGLEYSSQGQTSRLHPDGKYAEYWSGSADLVVTGIKIGEIKCYEKKKFAKYTDCILKKDIGYFKENFPEEYWQIVSNAIINEVDYGEAISYMPYHSELPMIQERVLNYDGDDQWKYRFIYESQPWELPLLPNNGYYKNINVWELKIPKEDMELLTERVDKAIILLNRPTV